MDDQRTDRVSGGVRYRKLRIAWSMVWGISCVLVVLLWIRSYWRVDSLQFPVSMTDRIGGWSVHGTIAVGRGTYQPGFFSQFNKSDAMLIKSLTGQERRRVTDELAYLQIERLNAVAKLQNKH